MLEKRGGKSELHLARKILIIIAAILVIFILYIIFIKNTFEKSTEIIKTCNDGTFYDSCSLNKPYYCENGTLIERSSFCGCPKNWNIKENSCQYSNLQKDPKVVQLKYFLNGKESYLNFTVYGGYNSYFDNLSKPYEFSTDEKASRRDFELLQVDDPYQREMLIPLVVEIQNLASNKEDQMRIAVSIVQNIPYGSSNETFKFFGQELNYTRYPYEILYDGYGLCDEKSSLLIFLLKEIGYSTSSFYYPSENHEAVGIKCPDEKSYLGSGYCFIETTGPSIITDYNGNYEFGKLSIPDISIISNGISLSEKLYEYEDGQEIMKLTEIVDKNGKLNYFQNITFEKLKEKYGIKNI
jgi:hypothetical protein